MTDHLDICAHVQAKDTRVTIEIPLGWLFLVGGFVVGYLMCWLVVHL